MGVELVEIQYQREGHGWVLRFFIDREGGVTLDDCAGVSREVSRYLEVEDPIEHAYHLEVSSPGLERPLKKKNDFVRFVGRRARIKMREKRDGQRVFIGTLQGVKDGDVLLHVDGRLHCFPLADISRARLILE
ncbi:MAG TPA: ribosome maturation factor RimP [Desulfobulbaceae bacterium]|nr:ribosome maturation factor RimP [Desulfobulbaceae bacterium]